MLACVVASIVEAAADNPYPKPTNTRNPSALASISNTLESVDSSPQPSVISYVIESQ